ncbi:hypothetical protein [Tunturiibacter gelidoferens]|uniref:Uncharacterized protein n=1 Tax=Tunturiibacter lichenicola TaxID=2051959 RepID=A0A7Y9NPS9_9BACT|nr:hypothetical protein [Edaphobacter lichenicola]NYF52733.1 hypothetical protein [Edaphobacter lichenicola]
MAALRSSVRLLERGHFEEPSIGPLPIGTADFGLPVPLQKKYCGFGFGPGRVPTSHFMQVKFAGGVALVFGWCDGGRRRKHGVIS